MTLGEAYELATIIHGNTDYAVLAIGRFLAIDLIRPQSPWGVSILRHRDQSRIVVWSEADWRQLHVGQLAKLSPDSSVGQLSKLSPSEPPAHKEQMLLF